MSRTRLNPKNNFEGFAPEVFRNSTPGVSSRERHLGIWHVLLVGELEPGNWGQGLALRMARTAITHAFSSSQIDSVIAGADLANPASFAVMRRLGMRFRKDVQYSLGAGVEYVLHRHDAGPLPKLALISLG
jgi:RimJ/RimL family protein N-acetyltransferase